MEVNHTNNQTGSDNGFHVVLLVVTWATLVVALPLTLMAIYGLYFFIKADHVAPVYVINLLISDGVQLCGNALSTVKTEGKFIESMYTIYFLGLIASVWFMVCIATERYIMIAYPVFYRNVRIKGVILVSLAVWIVSIVAVVIMQMVTTVDNYRVVIFLLPFPLLVGFLLGSWRALSKSHSLSPQRRRQILGTLALVLCIYMLFFLPYVTFDLIVVKLKGESGVARPLYYFFEVLLSLNPLLDPVLYVFMRRDAKNILQAFPCFGRGQSSREQSLETANTHTTAETPVCGSTC